MPVVSREKITFPGHGEFVKKIKYTSRSESFSIDLPNWMAESLDYSRVEGNTEIIARRKFDEAYEEYKARKTSIRKVIAYAVQIHAYIFDENDVCLLNKKDITFFEGDCAFGMGFKILHESTYNDRITYYVADGHRHKVDINDGWIVIDWTEDREKFFKETMKELESLILRVNKFFEDDKKFLDMIDNNQRLLENR